jgi:hypothetical protein
MLYYAGVGSRETPPSVIEDMFRIAIDLADAGLTLRSGSAPGADMAFETGCMASHGKIEIWVPDAGFNGRVLASYVPNEWHFSIASQLHPAWPQLKPYVRKLHARNVGQCAGADGSIKSIFVLCWTPDGCEEAHRTSRNTGGTGMAIRVAGSMGIPVINMKNAGWKVRLFELLSLNNIFIRGM